MNDFRASIIQGNFSQSRGLLGQILRKSTPPGSGGVLHQIEYLLYEQEYMELMERGLKMEAINILQREMMPRINRPI